eukprot:GEZU01012216.1.p1 GENE.GEZU01012216.1~~GEZU01012216.1.p1  ORF type:complete len:228 (-),score=48.15 GEZU01012216.1:507-1190(-)
MTTRCSRPRKHLPRHFSLSASLLFENQIEKDQSDRDHIHTTNMSSAESQQLPRFQWPDAASEFIKQMESKLCYAKLPKPDTNRHFIHGSHATDQDINDNCVKRFATEYFLNAEEKKIEGTVYFGNMVDGPPRCVHGGASAAILDSLMGTVVWRTGNTAVTANLNVSYHKLLPAEAAYRVQAFIESVDGKKITTKGRISSFDGVTTYVSSTALFVVIDMQNKMKQQVQ